ncbi:bleomycin resistance protein [Paenibacillus glucanolyticus]|jgi:methylmalonyl-CoA/ethylmalonyl-CoA epimerase|uniref:Bleomycin resistance protein n=1 Tax=Paenibacillus glucanolyticus TaxID=59843 RepID=A0A163KE55_9BACL|nr:MULTISPECIES: VOC family protein [Paenibacillus]ANA81116.1 bleomycin resistance protein [Paenibacillus glucanolyticus]AVV54765.1 bleomycin resistance protein [Paenibacillus glucanolyticus]AWP29413.1 bleomycin resistance protein [Paenibacillus sp. Cedars]ETT33716.1 methylmalonyl-CoA epimerase [Paenibacillus sp. FSL R5-808]KZS47162.1 bleomycin resistance protein [Paenibacillus glucanolyticus]
MNHMENNHLLKMGIVVHDIEAAARHYCELFGMEMPPISIPDPHAAPEPTEDSYTWQRGELRPTRTKMCVLKMGPMVLELLEPYDEPSPWNEYKQSRGQGVHFVMFTVNGFNQHIDFLEGKGYPLNHKGEYGAGRYGYFDSEDKLGVTLGLQELGPKQD